MSSIRKLTPPVDDQAVALAEPSAVLAAQANGPTPQAIKAYRAAVLAAGDSGHEAPPAGVLEASWRILPDWSRDLARYQRRLSARKDLDEAVPQLERKAAELAADLKAAEAFSGKPLAEFATLGELADQAGEIVSEHMPAHLLPFSGEVLTVEDLAKALATLPTAVLMFKSHAHNAATAAKGKRDQAEEVLYRTADPGIDERAQAVRNSIARLHGNIQGRERLVNIDAEIDRCRARCEKLARGERVDPIVYNSVGISESPILGTETPLSKLYERERVRLNKLLEEAQGKAAAIEANAADAADIPRLQAKLQAILAECLEPRNMKFQ